MVWLCPAYSRPKRLAVLAKSWEKCQPRTPLHVRLWSGDPFKEEYKKRRWPKTWSFYESSHQRVGPTLNEFAFEYRPGCETYGFIAEDVVLRTPGGLEHLAALAEPCYISYPNDMIQRWRLATHPCVGGELIRELGWWAHPDVEHGFDVPLMTVGLLCRLTRYTPFVVFDHQHFLRNPELFDEVYGELYTNGSKQPNSLMHMKDLEAIRRYQKEGEADKDAAKVIGWLHSLAEDPDEWAAEDRAAKLILPDSKLEFDRSGERVR